MKILVIGDVHWSQYSSILRKRGKKYSYRLENLIQSVNWAEQLALQANCELVVYLGDFFDRAEINSEEISALKEIVWASKPHYFLVGNHEAGRGELLYNSANLFGITDFTVVDSVKPLYIDNDDRVLFVPYILEENRLSLQEYLNKLNDDSYQVRHTLVFSHNDIKGFAMGKFISQEGFDIVDIDKNCDLYLNGHLHNGGRVSEKIINVGNLTGQNFSEDAFKYNHSVIVLDTDNLTCAVYENPYALNFYKLDFTVNNDIDYINYISGMMKSNCVATIKCNEDDLGYIRARFDPKHKDELIPYNCNMIETRIIVQSNRINNYANIESKDLHIDHFEQFSNYMIEHLGKSEVLEYELQKVCG